jgi:hypothetical protein
MVRKLMAFIERDAKAAPETALEPARPAARSAAGPVSAPVHNVPQTLRRETVQPFFRSSPKQAKAKK